MFLMVSVLAQVWTAVPEGRTEAEESFTRIRDVTTRERTVYVLEPFLRHLLMFDLTGRQLAVVGRKGQGPGEFSQPGRIGWKGDTLWVVDHPNRIHYFSPAGKFNGSYPEPCATTATSTAADGKIRHYSTNPQLLSITFSGTTCPPPLGVRHSA